MQGDVVLTSTLAIRVRLALVKAWDMARVHEALYGDCAALLPELAAVIRDWPGEEK